MVTAYCCDIVQYFGKGLLDFQSSPLKTKDFKVDLAVHLTKIMFMRHVCAYTYCGLDTASQNFERIFFFSIFVFRALFKPKHLLVLKSTQGQG